ncbi:hypothetical protein [Moorena producens]|nr:hypothetical protein [Moorena producens]
MQSLMGETTAKREWGEPPLAALPPQDRAASLLPKNLRCAFRI